MIFRLIVFGIIGITSGVIATIKATRAKKINQIPISMFLFFKCKTNKIILNLF